MFVTDLYANRTKFISSPGLCFLIGDCCFCCYMVYSCYNECCWICSQVVLLVVLFYIVLTNDRMKNIFSNRYIAIIGGCVILYTCFISAFCLCWESCYRKLQSTFPTRLCSYLFSLIHSAILSISGAYFLLIEKPFMRLRFGAKH
jgi:hypothetical protein